jgi:hypothetical protein
VKAYLHDPIGEKAREVKARYRGVCRGLRRVNQRAQRQGRCVRLLQALPSRGDRAAMDPRAEPRGDARLAKRATALRPPRMTGSRTHAKRRGGEALNRLQAGEWPAPSNVIDLYGSWAAGVADAFSGA